MNAIVADLMAPVCFGLAAILGVWLELNERERKMRANHARVVNKILDQAEQVGIPEIPAPPKGPGAGTPVPRAVDPTRDRTGAAAPRWDCMTRGHVVAMYGNRCLECKEFIG